MPPTLFMTSRTASISIRNTDNSNDINDTSKHDDEGQIEEEYRDTTKESGPTLMVDSAPWASSSRRSIKSLKVAPVVGSYISSGGKSLKIVLVGDMQTGKTSLIMTFITNVFQKVYEPAVTRTYNANVTVNSVTVEVGIWDMIGPDEHYIAYKNRAQAYPGADIFFVCFSVVSPTSFENAKKKWQPEITVLSPGTPFLFVGTKTDLRSDKETLEGLAKIAQRPVTDEEASLEAKTNGASSYVSCSALNQDGLKNVYDVAVKTVMGVNTANSGKKKKRRMCVMM